MNFFFSLKKKIISVSNWFLTRKSYYFKSINLIIISVCFLHLLILSIFRNFELIISLERFVTNFTLMNAGKYIKSTYKGHFERVFHTCADTLIHTLIIYYIHVWTHARKQHWHALNAFTLNRHSPFLSPNL